MLAEQLRDDRHLLTPTRCPEPHHVCHWLAVTDTHLALDDTEQAAQAHDQFDEAVEILGHLDPDNPYISRFRSAVAQLREELERGLSGAAVDP